ncbi:MAG: tRNA (N6-isopentenyl adenosine(37)-C2)-methylthiotransferase MiaB [Clostridia bacterium]|nr:tRNA (N6-isopentenyl adenosine(37)-C2)-methylthiotransferase MiaB [Clostridia bacterium]
MYYYKIYTYGCQMNVHESEKLAGMLKQLNYEETLDDNKADVIVFNTCCIRENAEQHAIGNIGALKPLKKKKKDLIIAVGGCMTQQNGKAEYLKNTFPFVDVIFGTSNLNMFKEYLQKRLKTGKKVVEVIDGNYTIDETVKPYRTSYPNAWVNIMYGCNNFCSYCIVPYVRGREISREPAVILNEVKELVKSGYKEITLLGQNVDSYGKTAHFDYDFADLLTDICKIDGKFRLRFMSNHPKDITKKVVDAISKNDKTCKCIHLPLQSASTKILGLMNRKYTFEDYYDKVKMLKTAVPNCAITTDIMVGFPNETEEDFLDTYNATNDIKFDGAFTFVYSRRNGTKAFDMDGQIDDATKKDRIMRLVELQNAINAQKSTEYVGKTVEVLCEDYDEKRGLYLGRDEFSKMIYFSSEKSLIGEFVMVKITKAGGMSLYGEIGE